MIRRTLFDLDARVTNVLGSLLCTGESYGERTLIRQHEARRPQEELQSPRRKVCQGDELPRNRPRSCVHARGYTLPRDGRRRGGWRTSRLAETRTLLLLFLLPSHIVLDFFTISYTGLIV